MKKSALVGALVAVAVCAVSLAALGSAKNPVSRPFQYHGVATGVINLADGTWTMSEVGEGTHLGRITNTGSGTGWGAVATGVVTTANRDQIFWVQPGSSWPIEFTSGTGRFVGCTGGFKTVEWKVVSDTYPDSKTEVLVVAYTAAGTIAY